jgi:hypothetical protein
MPLHISVALSQQSAGLPPPPPQLVNPAPHTHALLTHDEFATHTTPQAPQFASFDASSASQPVPGRPSQSLKPTLHMAIVHDPAVHALVALAAVHARPHIPQLVTVLVAASQPLAALPSQLPKPMLQLAIAHEPVAHVGVALATVQGAPHAPQFVTELSRTSHPFASLESQSAKPMLQVAIEHVAAAHAPLAFAGAHALLHIPQ